MLHFGIFYFEKILFFFQFNLLDTLFHQALLQLEPDLPSIDLDLCAHWMLDLEELEGSLAGSFLLEFGGWRLDPGS